MPGLFKDLFAGKAVLLYQTGDFVALDTPSGGYPYKAIHPSQVHFWVSLEEAIRYREAFPNEKFTAHRVERLEILQEKYSY